MLESNPEGFREAQKFADHIAELVGQYLALRDNKSTFGSPEMLALEDAICASVRPGIWEHCKSSPEKPMFYEVFGVEPQVNYQIVGHVFQVRYAALYLPMR